MASHHPANAGLYIHIPFCIRKCPYCDFYSLDDLTAKPAFLQALLKEMEMTTDYPVSFDTVYLGGGTPSVLDARDMDWILAGARKFYRILPDPEITIEVNPGATKLSQLEDFRKAGINRINIGVQSFQTLPLQFLGRIHSKKDAYQAIQWARDAGFENLGIDLMYGLPDQTKKSWLRDLQEAVAFEPEHLSCYMLTYGEDTPLDRQRREGRFLPMEDDSLADLFETTIAYLKVNGYDHYEVSNFEKSALRGFEKSALRGFEKSALRGFEKSALRGFEKSTPRGFEKSTPRGFEKSTPRGFEKSAPRGLGESDSRGKGSYRSKHNQKYWTYAPYLGLGPSAHSFLEPVRHWNSPDIDQYIAALAAGQLPIQEKEHLSREQQMMEWVYLGLRQTDGIPIHHFNRQFNADFYGLFGKIVDALKEETLMKADDARCALTRKGLLLLDSIVDRFLIVD